MTKDEAIANVKAAFSVWEGEFGTGDDWSEEHEARDMAIEALKSEPVRHGRWIVHTDMWAHGAEYFSHAVCSECGDTFYAIATIGNKPIWDYCPNCGAKMDGEMNETD